MQFPEIINRNIRYIVLSAGVVLAVVAARAQQADQYKAYSSYPDTATVVEAKQEARLQHRQWRQDCRAVSNTWSDAGAEPEIYRYGYSYPVVNKCHTTPFRWNDVAGITAMALGAYILFR